MFTKSPIAQMVLHDLHVISRTKFDDLDRDLGHDSLSRCYKIEHSTLNTAGSPFSSRGRHGGAH